MEAQEQMMLQLWFENLRAMMEREEYDKVKSELDAALGRIEEDQREAGTAPAGS